MPPISAGVAFVDIVPSFRDFGRQLQTGVNRSMSGVQRDITQRFDAVNRQVGAGVAKSSKGFSNLARSGAAAFGGFQIGRGLTNVFNEVDTGLDTIRTQTGATGSALKGLEASFKRVGGAVPDNLTQVGQVMADVASRTNLTGKPLEILTARLLDLQRTGPGAGATAATITRIFGDWSIATGDQTKALDKLFRASQATGVPVEQLGQLAVKFGGPFRQLGFSFDEAAVLLGKFEKEGVNTELVAGSLRIALGKMARAGVKDVPKALEASIKAIRNAGSAGAANAKALELFGARAGPDMAAAIREGRFDIGALFNQVASGTDTVKTAADDALDFGDKLKILANKAKLVVAPIGEFGQVIGGLGAGLGALSGTGAFKSIGSGFSKMFGLARVAVARLTLALTGGRVALAAHNTTMAVSASTTAATAGRFTQLGAAVRAFALGPLGLLVTGLAAAGGFYYALNRRIDATGEGLAKFREATTNLNTAQKAFTDRTRTLSTASDDLAAAQKRVRNAQADLNDIRGDSKRDAGGLELAERDLNDAEKELEATQKRLAAATTARAAAQSAVFKAQRDQLEGIGLTLEKVFKPGLLDRFSASRAPDVMRQLAAAMDELRRAGIPIESIVQQINALEIRSDQKAQLKALAKGFYDYAGAAEEARVAASKAFGVEIDVAKNEKAFAGQLRLVDGLVESYGKLAPQTEEVTTALDELVKQTAAHAFGVAREQTALGKYTDANTELLRELGALKQRYPQLAGQIDKYLQKVKASILEQQKQARTVDLVHASLTKVKNLPEKMVKRVESVLVGMVDGRSTNFQKIEEKLRAIKNLDPRIRKDILAKLKTEIDARIRVRVPNVVFKAYQVPGGDIGIRGQTGMGTVLLHEGGWAGGRRGEELLRLLEGREFVLREEAARAIPPARLDQLNSIRSRADFLRMFESDLTFQAQRGGESGIAKRGGDTFNVTVNNPKPERLELTLPAALRRAELLRARS